MKSKFLPPNHEKQQRHVVYHLYRSDFPSKKCRKCIEIFNNQQNPTIYFQISFQLGQKYRIFIQMPKWVAEAGNQGQQIAILLLHKCDQSFSGNLVTKLHIMYTMIKINFVTYAAPKFPQRSGDYYSRFWAKFWIERQDSRTFHLCVVRDSVFWYVRFETLKINLQH